ncbi:hypothetical protein PCE1_004637 [Barthelona sp. PCE]
MFLGRAFLIFSFTILCWASLNSVVVNSGSIGFNIDIDSFTVGSEITPNPLLVCFKPSGVVSKSELSEWVHVDGVFPPYCHIIVVFKHELDVFKLQFRESIDSILPITRDFRFSQAFTTDDKEPYVIPMNDDLMTTKSRFTTATLKKTSFDNKDIVGLHLTASSHSHFSNLLTLHADDDRFTIKKVTDVTYIVKLKDLSVIDEVIETFANSPAIIHVEPLFTISLHNEHAIDVALGSKTSLIRSRYTGFGSVVGIADSGIDLNSCFFHDPNHEVPVGNINMEHRKVVAYFSFGDQDDYKDGHGTHVAATIAGKALENTHPQIQELDGVAGDAKICFFDLAVGKVLNTPASIANSIFRVARDECNVRIHSNSWGFVTNTYTFASRDIDAFVFDNQDFLPIFSVGNFGHEGRRTIVSPANAKNVLGVGATLTTHQGHLDACCPYDENPDYCCGMKSNIKDNPTRYNEETVAEYSSRGPTLDGRFKPDVLAVGGPVRSVRAKAEGADDHCDYNPLVMSGTSMAAPVVAGAAVLLREMLVETHSNCSAALLKLALMISSKAPARAEIGIVLDPAGYISLLDIEFKFAKYTGVHHSTDKPVFFETYLRRNDRVGLVWTDPASSPGTIFQLVNTLHLTVVQTDGIVHHPDDFTGRDYINNAQFFTAPRSGTFQFSVSASKLMIVPQNFEVGVYSEEISGSSLSTVVPTCFNGSYDGFVCVCDKGYTGDFCEISPCPEGCPNGNCIDGVCQCAPSWLGNSCKYGLCSGETSLLSFTGTIRSHNDPMTLLNYFSNQNCRWRLANEGQKAVRLKFKRFCIEESFDFVRVYSDDVLISTFTGCSMPEDQTIIGSDVIVEFSSDSSVELSGFIIDYISISNDCINGCGSGFCSAGVCHCDQLYSGPSCENSDCDSACSGSGTCQDGSCDCHFGFSGKRCEKFGCPSNFKGSTAAVDIKPVKGVFNKPEYYEINAEPLSSPLSHRTYRIDMINSKNIGLCSSLYGNSTVFACTEVINGTAHSGIVPMRIKFSHTASDLHILAVTKGRIVIELFFNKKAVQTTYSLGHHVTLCDSNEGMKEIDVFVEKEFDEVVLHAEGEVYGVRSISYAFYCDNIATSGGYSGVQNPHYFLLILFGIIAFLV